MTLSFFVFVVDGLVLALLGTDAGSEELYLHAARDHSVRVADAMDTRVGENETHVVGASLSRSVDGEQRIEVGHEQRIEIGNNLRVAVEGGNRETLGGAEVVNVSNNRWLISDGPHTEVIGGGHYFTCNQENTKVTGAMLRVVGRNQRIEAVLGMQESVAGARTFVCRGAHVVRCTKAYKEKIIGLKNTRTTLASEHAGSDVGSKGKRLNIDAGSLSIEAPSGISFKAQRIDLDVSGALVADSLEISGGKLRPKEGIAQIEGNAQKLGGGKVGA